MPVKRLPARIVCSRTDKECKIPMQFGYAKNVSFTSILVSVFAFSLMISDGCNKKALGLS